MKIRAQFTTANRLKTNEACNASHSRMEPFGEAIRPKVMKPTEGYVLPMHGELWGWKCRLARFNAKTGDAPHTIGRR